jgi:hypothetical protein
MYQSCCIGQKNGTFIKKQSGGNARPRSMDIIGNDVHSTLYNTFVYGSGVGATNLFTRSAQMRAMTKADQCACRKTSYLK